MRALTWGTKYRTQYVPSSRTIPVTERDVLVLPIHSPSALGTGGAGAAPPFPPLPPHAANASIHDMAKALIIAIVLGFTIAPCDYCGGARGSTDGDDDIVAEDLAAQPILRHRGRARGSRHHR